MYVLKKADRGYMLLSYEPVKVHSRFVLFDVYKIGKGDKKYVYKSCLDKIQYKELEKTSLASRMQGD